MVTIKDIALQLNISPSTVARALADHPHTSDATKARVRTAASDLGYVVHAAARMMRGQSSKLIGLIIPDVQNDFYATVAKTLAETCNSAGFQLVLAITEDEPATENKHIRELISARAAGIVIVPCRSPWRDTIKLLKGLPVVQLIRNTPGLGADWFGIDDESAIHEATMHLSGLGHTRLAYIGGHQELSTGAARLAGFNRGLREADIDLGSSFVATGPPRAAFAKQTFVEMIKKFKPTGLISGGSRLTYGILEGVSQTGVRVPGDLSIVGFGDSPWSRWWGNGLTTIGLPIQDIAHASGALLLRRIEQSKNSNEYQPVRPSRAVLSSFLVKRDSTASLVNLGPDP
ncbi:MAG: LacI family transcriptional regulator [Alphaproteobacteria bacterium]|nr:LacI family transcriptional regulator [Alphaproteobacteria bacterium]